MDPVDILTMAVRAAQLIRSSSDPERTMAIAHAELGLSPPADVEEPMAVRVARLVDRAGDRRGDLDQILLAHCGPLPFNREAEARPSGQDEPDPEAVRLSGFVDEEADDAIGFDLFAGTYPPFSVAERASVHFFDRASMADQAKGRPAGEVEPALGELLGLELPVVVRGLIDYPIEAPVLFAIETGAEPWNVWEICLAFADQYRKIYEAADRFGVWGHDLTDLWIEGLVYYPSERLIYPYVGS